MIYAITAGTIFPTFQETDPSPIFALDGSDASLATLRHHLEKYGGQCIIKPPAAYIASLRGPETISKPVLFDDVFAFHKWKARHLYAKVMTFTARSVRREDSVETPLDFDTMVSLTYIARKVYAIYQEAGGRFCIPPLILDTLSRCTHYLTKETMNIEEIRGITGFQAPLPENYELKEGETAPTNIITYNRALNMLEFDIRDQNNPDQAIDYYTVPLPYLDKIYTSMVLPILRSLKYRVIAYSCNGVSVTLGAIALMTLSQERPVVSRRVSSLVPIERDILIPSLEFLDYDACPEQFMTVSLADLDTPSVQEKLTPSLEKEDVYAFSNDT